MKTRRGKAAAILSILLAMTLSTAAKCESGMKGNLYPGVIQQVRR